MRYHVEHIFSQMFYIYESVFEFFHKVKETIRMLWSHVFDVVLQNWTNKCLFNPPPTHKPYIQMYVVGMGFEKITMQN